MSVSYLFPNGEAKEGCPQATDRYAIIGELKVPKIKQEDVNKFGMYFEDYCKALYEIANFLKGKTFKICDEFFVRCNAIYHLFGTSLLDDDELSFFGIELVSEGLESTSLKYSKDLFDRIIKQTEKEYPFANFGKKMPVFALKNDILSEVPNEKFNGFVHYNVAL